MEGILSRVECHVAAVHHVTAVGRRMMAAAVMEALLSRREGHSGAPIAGLRRVFEGAVVDVAEVRVSERQILPVPPWANRSRGRRRLRPYHAVARSARSLAASADKSNRNRTVSTASHAPERETKPAGRQTNLARSRQRARRCRMSQAPRPAATVRRATACPKSVG